MTHTQPPATPFDIGQPLPEEVATLQDMVRELLATLRQQQRDNEVLRHRLDLLVRRLYGPRTERFDPNQSLLFDKPASAADTTTTPTEQATFPADTTATSPEQASATPDKPRRCRPHGRRRLPDNLPREIRHHELPQAARLCAHCGQTRLDIGVDKSEQLEYRPASLQVIEHVVHKYVCPCCSRRSRAADAPAQSAESQTASLPPPCPDALGTLSMAEQTMNSRKEPDSANIPTTPSREPTPASNSPLVPPQSPPPPPPPPPPAAQLPQPAQPAPVVVSAAKAPMPIAKGLPGPGLLAHLIVSKYTDHLPLHRLERIYERQGVFLPRSTLCDWLAACSLLLQPLYQLMVRMALQSRALHTDDTTVKMQDPRTRLLSTARLWVYLGDLAHPYNVFDFTVNRKRDGPQQFLADYQGYLHADAFSGYDCLYLPRKASGTADIVEVACNAHARRKFYEARSSDALRSHVALAYYRQLYELERSADRNDLHDEQRLQMRRDFSLPILNQFKHWLDSQRAEVLPKSPLGEAVSYTLNNWTALVRYTEAGFLSIDNNVAEREMKRIAIGRKNWLFVGSRAGGRTAAVLISFTSTCQRLGVEPWSYLQDVLSRLPTTAHEQLDSLLPDRWQAATPTPGSIADVQGASSSPQSESHP